MREWLAWVLRNVHLREGKADFPEAPREKCHSFLQTPKKVRTPLFVFIGLGWNPGLGLYMVNAVPLA